MRDALPKASFIGFTGTPIELTDKNTQAVFGEYISVYDIQRAVEDKRDRADLLRGPAGEAGAQESEERPKLDPGFEEATEGEEVEKKESQDQVGSAGGDWSGRRSGQADRQGHRGALGAPTLRTAWKARR
jgi:type I site-specific restriction-modification system R (restriction) subunit